MYAFEITQPNTIADAVTALQDEEAQALGGGQTLIPTLKARLAMPETLVSLTRIPELQGICIGDDGAICIGAATSHATVAQQTAKTFPALAALADHIGDPAVRNRGTIGGSLANNDPAACYPAIALATNALIITNARQIPAVDFFQGLFTTDLEENEIITEIRFPVPTQAAYQKFVQPASRFAMVGVFLARFDDDIRVAVTGASDDGVYRWKEAEAALATNFNASALAPLAVPQEGMIADIHASAAYRAHLVKVMTSRAVTQAQSG